MPAASRSSRSPWSISTTPGRQSVTSEHPNTYPNNLVLWYHAVLPALAPSLWMPSGALCLWGVFASQILWLPIQTDEAHISINFNTSQHQNPCDISSLLLRVAQVTEQLMPQLTMVGWPWPAARPHPAALSLPLLHGMRNRMESSWVEIKAGRWLTNYHYKQNRFNLGKINQMHCQFKQ